MPTQDPDPTSRMVRSGDVSALSGIGMRKFWVGLVGALVLIVAALAAFTFFILKKATPVEAEVQRDGLVLMDGQLRWLEDTNRVFSGWMTEAYPDGKLRSRSHVVDGRLDGLSEGWYSDGQMEIRESFSEGLAEGPVMKWHPNGNLRSEGMAAGGVLQGVFRRWHTNGILAEEVQMDGGEPHGTARAWDLEGQLKAEVQMRHGKVVRGDETDSQGDRVAMPPP